jgi:hypothetical protein
MQTDIFVFGSPLERLHKDVIFPLACSVHAQSRAAWELLSVGQVQEPSRSIQRALQLRTLAREPEQSDTHHRVR